MDCLYHLNVGVFLFSLCIGGCNNPSIINTTTSTPTINFSTKVLPKNSPTAEQITSKTSPTSSLTDYEFPDSINPKSQYLFYLHGKILEDQGLSAVSPEYGVYEYEAILNKFSSYGFNVISEQRPKNADVNVYARKTERQIGLLLNADVPPESITVVGASKGAYIAASVSYILKNNKVNFVLLGACNPEITNSWILNQVYLVGNILAIYDSIDEYAGSCEDLFIYSQGKGIARHEEIVLHMGLGHGILYKPLDDWIIPIVQFVGIDLPSR